MAISTDERGFSDGYITARKEDLLTALRKNRDQHEKDYIEAHEGWKIEVLKELERTTLHFKQTGILNRNINLPEPENQTKHYDRVIRMLELSLADDVEISEQQFAHYVMDEWDWSGRHKLSVANYAGATRMAEGGQRIR